MPQTAVVHIVNALHKAQHPVLHIADRIYVGEGNRGTQVEIIYCRNQPLASDGWYWRSPLGYVSISFACKNAAVQDAQQYYKH